MDRYRVVQVLEVDADDLEDALNRVDAGEGVRSDAWARVARLPEDRYRTEFTYTQTIPTLDVAWDRFMDLTLPDSTITEYPGEPRLPSFLAFGGNTVAISMLFDCAITAYRQRLEGRDT